MDFHRCLYFINISIVLPITIILPFLNIFEMIVFFKKKNIYSSTKFAIKFTFKKLLWNTQVFKLKSLFLPRFLCLYYVGKPNSSYKYIEKRKNTFEIFILTHVSIFTTTTIISGINLNLKLQRKWIHVNYQWPI